MDIYTMNGEYEPDQIIDGFSSFIWTDRYAAFGDFVLKAAASSDVKKLLPEGAMLGHRETKSLMVVDKVIEQDVEGDKTLSITGKSLESWLMDKTTPAKTKMSGFAGSVAGNIARKVLVEGTGISPNDVIPNLVVKNYTQNTEQVSIEVNVNSLYDTVKQICDADNLGFKLGLHSDPTESKLRLMIYEGLERPDAFFSTQLDTLYDTATAISSENYKNVAYVLDKDDNVTIIANSLPKGQYGDWKGAQRRVLMVDAKDMDPEDYPSGEFKTALRQRGRQALAEHKKLMVFDGIASPISPIKYGEHYSLGDIVYYMNDAGKTYPVRVTEHIWSVGAEGEASYPTFELVE